jgi:hypothetical protein
MLEHMRTTPVPTSAPTVDQLAADEALRLMAGAPIGRVIFTEGALPAIRPVHFLFDGADVVFRIVADQRLAAALHNTVVAFEADAYDAVDGTGWTATATGHATRVDNVAEITRLDGLLPRPWGPEAVLFRMEAEVVTGRRVGY